jgi:GDPmannose 4,6-dehydratase
VAVALITGIAGQDGHYLAELLHAAGVEVWGATPTGRAPAALPFVRMAPPAEVRDQAALERAVAAARPDQVYHLAAQSSVGESWADPAATGDVTGLGTARLLEAVRREAPAARVFVASSSEVFGEPERAPQDESTPIRPVSPYGAAKAYAHHLARIYRRRYGLRVAVGILYNHESSRRPASFVTRKITRGAAAIARGEQRELRLGNLDARRDWGFAGDYARAMALMLDLDHPEPDEFVVATGETHTVREWCELAFARVGLDYRQFIVGDPALWRPAEPVPLVGDSSKARRLLGWAPSLSFPELVHLMVDADLARVGG